MFYVSLPAAACWDMLLVPYRDRMESLDMGFLVVSSILVEVLPSLNKSSSPFPAAVLAPPPAAAAAGACVRVLTKVLELTLKEDTDPTFWKLGNENMEKKQDSLIDCADDVWKAKICAILTIFRFIPKLLFWPLNSQKSFHNKYAILYILTLLT